MNEPTVSPSAQPAIVSAMRRFLAAILFFGMAGTTVELLFLDHVEDWLQAIPILLIAVAMTLLIGLFLRPSAAVVHAVRATMLLFVLSGLAGVVLHGRASMEFQREMDPSVGGLELLWKILRAKAPPALAPGLMVQLGLLGLGFCFRHPLLEGRSDGSLKEGV